MLRFFRINDPYRVLFIMLVLIVIRVVQGYFFDTDFILSVKWRLLGEWLGNGFILYRETYDYTGPLAALVYKYLDILFGRSAFVHTFFSTLLIIVQAGIFNRILIRNKAFDESTYLPAFFYMLVASVIPDFMSLSPQLMSMTFILLAFGSVLRRIDNQATDELFLNSGVFVGIATMIHLPSCIFLFVFLFALIAFSSAILRRLLIYLFGFSLSLGLCSSYFYWRGDLVYFYQSFFYYGFTLDANNLVSVNQLLVSLGPLTLIFILTLIRSFSKARLTNFQQRIQRVLWFVFLGGVICFFLSVNKAALEVVFLIPLISYFLTQYFLLLKNRIFRFLMPGLVVFGLIGMSIYVYSTQHAAFMVTPKSQLSDKKVLVLGEDFGYYLNQPIGSPCFDQTMCGDAFEGLAYYDESSAIYRWITKSDPEVIIDQVNAVPKLFHRFPTLEKSFQEREPNRYHKISN